MKIPSFAVFAVAVAPLIMAPAASAQSLLVEVTAAESGAPLVGAFVALLDADDAIVRRALTDGDGRAVLPAGTAGTFRVRAELIGRETATSAPVALAQGESARVSLALASHAFSLGELRVEVEDRCQIRPDEATDLQRAWDEARKAITVQAWAEGEGAYRLTISSYDRDLDAEGRRVEREERRRSDLVTRVPFRSLPPEELMAGGFMRRLDDGGFEYFGPDAALLLSDLFLDTHCFRLTRSTERPGALGLAFEPVRVGGQPDVRGVFWLDEASAALRTIEYWYTEPPYPEAAGVAGGRVEFDRLPNGAWIIERWTIRAPLLARAQHLARAGDSGIRVIGIRETGGEVLSVSTLDRRTISTAERGTVQGVLWDSTAAAPLPGARVRLAGTVYATETDEEGRFALTDLPTGVFTATFSHPRLDSLGVVELPGVEAEVVAGGTAEITLAIPSRATLLVAACQAEAGDGVGAGDQIGAVLSGVVRDPRGETLPGAVVRIEWQEVERLEPVAQATNEWIEVQTDADGRYTACGVPVDEALQVRAAFLTERGPIAEVAFTDETHRTLDLEVDLGAPALAGVAARGSTAGGGTQGVQGRLVEHDGGRPVRSAEVTLRSGSDVVLASGTTDERGFFRLQVPRAGRFLLTAEALGYADLESHVVEIEPERLTVLEITIAATAFELEPIVVTTEARSFHLEMEGFYRRREQGLGVFMTPELIEERRAPRTSDLFFGVPGTRVGEPSLGAGPAAVYFRSGQRDPDICWPMVYVDNHLVSTGGLLNTGAQPAAVDELVFPADILAIEVFRSGAEVPSEFSGPNAGCGVIVLWTRRGRAG